MIRKRSLVLLITLLLSCALVPQMALAQDATLTAGSAAIDVPSSVQSANPQVKYRAYVGSSWTSGWASQGKSLGTAGKMIQLLRVKVVNDGVSGSVKYRIYAKYKGWQDWTSNGKMVGTKGWRFRGIQMKLTGKLGKYYDIVYRVYLEDSGWMPWTLNGATSGSTGSLGQVEKIQVKLVLKGSTQKISNGGYFVTLAKKPNVALAVPGSKTAEGVQLAKASQSAKALNERFFVRKSSDGSILLQSCVSGLYLCERNGKIVQRTMLNSKKLRWKASWNGGFILTNVGTGHELALANGKAVASTTGDAWEFTTTSIIPDGTFTVSNGESGVTMIVKNASKSNGAPLIMKTTGNAGAKAFVFQHLSGNVFKIKNAASDKYVEVKDGSTDEGAIVRQNAAKNAGLQKWKAMLDPDGGFVFTNRASGRALSAEATGATGEAVVSSTFVNDGSQKWALKASSYKRPTVGPDSGPGAIAAARSAEYAKSIWSDTNYFIAVDLTNNWVCIYKGAVGSRELYKSYICSGGAPSSPTPTGEFTIWYRQYSFGDGYTCYYATAFLGYEYLFHSVLYNEGTFTIQDGRLGQSISHGCVRMDIDDAHWIYDNIPDGTKVKIFK